jgi:type IV secretion system protein VirD4
VSITRSIPAARIRWLPILAAVVLVLGSSWTATQWTAAQLGYQEALGSPWQVIAGYPVYLPIAFYGWWFVYDAYAPAVFLRGAVVAASGGLLSAAAAVVLSISAAKDKGPASTFGSARWARAAEVRSAGLTGEAGVVLGQLDGVYLRHDGAEHVLCFAPTRSGKGVGLVVPTLLTWAGSTIIHDIKGENWTLTAGFRAKLGRVLLFDPTNLASSAYNPLLEVRRGDFEVRDVQNIADILVDPEGSLDKRSHWEKTSHALLVGAILHVLYAETDKTLAGVATFLSDPQRTIEQTLSLMMRTAHLEEDGPHPVVASAARELLNKSDNERSGVLSTAMTFLGLYRDPVVAAVTARCDWRISDLVDDGPCALYLVVPPSDVSRTKPLIRLLLNQIVRRLTESLQGVEARQPMLLMLDELPVLGRLDFLESTLAFMAGYRVRAFLITQSLNQIERAYGPNNAILDNCHVRVCFATNDERTAKRVSDALGTATEERAMRNYAGHRLSPWLGHLMVSKAESPRPLLTPGEIMQLPADEELVMLAGSPPMRARKVRYYEDGRFTQRILPPPAPGRGRRQADGWAAAAPPRPLLQSPGAIDDAGDGQDGPEARVLAIAIDPPAPNRPIDEFGFEDQVDRDDVDERQRRQRLMRRVARQAVMDPDDGVEL